MKHVRNRRDTKRYRFPTHTNDLIFDRAEARASESFFVVLEEGEAPPRHKHDDTEQVFYIIEGRGTLRIGDNDKACRVKPGDVVLVPSRTWHSIRSSGGPMRYLAVDCFLSEKARLEPTWDEHAQAMCRERGWDYAKVTGRPQTAKTGKARKGK
jgi:mannose-6-phosphate isomerase-like protein (cupin superfamily)